MKQFSIIEPPSEKFVKLALTRMGREFDEFGSKDHPQEDFIKISDKHPIFVVADGVTLIQSILDKQEYPNPSPAGDVARIFCEEFIRTAEEKYSSFEESDIRQIFDIANKAVGKYNAEHGRTKETVDFWNNDFYAATAAFVVIKDSRAYWGSICDSYVTHFDKNGSLQFFSPKCHELRQAEAAKFMGNISDQKAKAIYTWSTNRNGINEKGERIGYGVVTGEREASEYLSVGSFLIETGDSIALLTDGFEDYLKLPEMATLFVSWPVDIESQLKNFTYRKAEEDPEAFGHERSLIAIKID